MATTSLAVIRGSAINHDGPASGLTVPSRRAQAAVIRQALAAGRVDPLDVDYVEAHGTGTSLGDPIEIGALGDALGQKRPPDRPLHVGSVKTNFGHLEAAAGIAGLIKVVLALRHGAIPPHLGFRTPNPNIDWEQFPVTVPTGLMEWPRSPRVAGVSSFGFSGTNAHIVLEATPTKTRDEPSAPAPYLLTLSARSETALTDMARRYAETLDDSPSAPGVEDACYTSHVGRTHFRHRLAVVGASSPELGRTLRTFAEGGRPRTVSTGEVAAGSDTPRVAFLCTGQGSQYVGMGRELSETEPVFRETLERCDALLRPRLATPLLDVLYALPAEDSPLGETAYTQPALFALEYALATLWRSWGVEPSVVMGHSVGEYVAACLAGIVSLDDGLRLIAERGRLMQALPRDGAMVALLTDEATVVEALAPHTANVAIASVNGPRNVVVSGRRAAVDAVVATLTDAGVETRPLAVSHAFHSPLMDPMLDEFERLAEQVTYAPPRLRLLSNVTGAVDPDAGTSARYWRRHVREPVRFADGMTTLGQEGCEVFLEIGPQPTLLGMGRQCLPDTTGDERTRAWVPSLRRGRSDRGQLLHALGELHVQGVPVDWSAVHRDRRGRRVALPTYPFERDRFWVAQDASQMETTVVSSTTRSERHPLLGRRQHTAGLPPGTVVFETQLSPVAPSYLADHHVFGRLIPPATTYVEVALAAGARLLGTPHLVLEDVVVHQPLVLDEETPSTIQCVATPDGPTRRLQVFGLVVDDRDGTAEPADEPRWTLLCSTTVRRSDPQLPVTDTTPAPTEAAPPTDEPLPVSDCYARFRAQGLDLGPRFQAIETLTRRGRHAVGNRGPSGDGRDRGTGPVSPAPGRAGRLRTGGGIGLPAAERRRDLLAGGHRASRDLRTTRRGVGPLRGHAHPSRR